MRAKSWLGKILQGSVRMEISDEKHRLAHDQETVENDQEAVDDQETVENDQEAIDEYEENRKTR
jgi:hypothetical protein